MKDYDGSGSARRFFVNCEREFKDLSTHSWIYAVEACFTGKAAEWVSQQSEIQDILDLEEPDEEDKQRFIALVRRKYPDRKPPTRKQWMIRLKELKQNENDESLGQYYRRTHDILRGLGGEDKEEDDDVFSRLELTILDQIIEKFVDGLNDSQLRYKMRYKYLTTPETSKAWSLYGAYEVAEQISSYIASKKKALEDEFEKEVSTVMQTQGTAAALKFAMKNQPESYTQKPKSISVDRIKRYRRVSQQQKPESTMQKNTPNENSQPCEVFTATTARTSKLKSPSNAVPGSKLTQPYTDTNSSDSNVSALGRILGGSQTTPHSDNYISENMMALPSQSEPNRDPVSNEQDIRPEEPAEREEPTEIYASGPSKWPTTLPDTAAVNKSPQISLQKSYQMQENCSVSSPRTSSSAHSSKPWLTQNWRVRFHKTVDESPPILEEMSCDLSESCKEDITNTPGKPVASESVDWPVSTSLQKSSPEAGIVNESPPVLEQIKPERPEISTAVLNIINTELSAEPIASESITSMQKPPFETSTAYESPLTLEEMPREISEISATIENTSDTESMDEDLASGSRRLAVVSRSLQKSSPEASIINESLPVLEQIPPEISETNASIMDISDTESKKDEVLASGSSNWNAAAAEKEVFQSTRTLHAISKSPRAPHIEKDIEAEDVAESIVDVETQNQKVFALATLYDIFSKNSPAPYFEISAAVDAPSLENLTNEDGLVTGAFDSMTGIAAFSKNPLIQHTEDLKTWEKDSIYTYELPAFSAFDLSIDIDFEAYITDSVTYSSTQSPSPPIPPVTLQAVEETSDYGREQVTCSSDSSVTLQATEATSGYGREQSSTCSADYMTSYYEGEQVTCSADTVDTTSDVTTKPEDITVTKPVVHHALLAYCLAWIQYVTMPCMILWTLYEYITLWDLPTEYKARPKVKIKRLLEPYHIDSRSRTVAGISIESAYKIALFSGNSTMVRTLEINAKYTHKMATFSDTAIRINTSGISAVFAYKMALFSSELQWLETFESEVFGPAYDFGFRACRTVT